VDGVVYELAEGDIMIMPPGHARSARQHPEKTAHIFGVNFNVYNIYGKTVELPFPLVSHPGRQEDLIRLFDELVFIWLEQPPLYTLKCQAIFMLILHRLFEKLVFNIDVTAKDYRIEKVIRYIGKHYPEKLTVKILAEQFGFNPVYFGDLFRQSTGMTVKQYLARIRLRQAENMLLTGEYRVGDVAEHCGYNDLSYFDKQFTRQFGCSPSKILPRSRNY
jgi:AraC-like DNA-binding protein